MHHSTSKKNITALITFDMNFYDFILLKNYQKGDNWIFLEFKAWIKDTCSRVDPQIYQEFTQHEQCVIKLLTSKTFTLNACETVFIDYLKTVKL